MKANRCSNAHHRHNALVKCSHCIVYCVVNLSSHTNDGIIIEIIVPFSIFCPSKAKQINITQQIGLQLSIPFTDGQLSSYILVGDQHSIVLLHFWIPVLREELKIIVDERFLQIMPHLTDCHFLCSRFVWM